MKIVIVGPAYPLRGGIAHFTGLLYNILRKRGHDVKVITFKRQYPKFLFPGKTQLEKDELPFEINTEQLIDSINPLNWFSVSLKILKEKPDVVIFKYWMPFFAPCYGTLSLLLKALSRAKIIFLCHNIVPHEKTFLDNILTKYAFAFADSFIVQSESVEKDLLSIKKDAKYLKVHHPVYEIFGSGIDKLEARKKLGLKPDEKILLFFGYVRAYKGLDLLLQAMKFVLTKMSVRLLVVGEFYDEPEKYFKIIREEGIEDYVVIKGEYVPNSEVSVYFSASDVVVLPYVSATQSGIVQIAYNFDKPVIATNVGGLPEVVIDGKTGFIVEPKPEKIAEAVVRFFEEDRGENFSENIRKMKQRFSWNKIAEAIEFLTLK